MANIGSDVDKIISNAVKAKLIELGSNAYLDNDLPDYVMIMVANKRSKAEMIDELQLFLEKRTEVFVNWLHEILHKLKDVKVPKVDATEIDTNEPKDKQKVNECTIVKTETADSFSVKNVPRKCEVKSEQLLNNDGGPKNKTSALGETRAKPQGEVQTANSIGKNEKNDLEALEAELATITKKINDNKKYLLQQKIEKNADSIKNDVAIHSEVIDNDMATSKQRKSKGKISPIIFDADDSKKNYSTSERSRYSYKRSATTDDDDARQKSSFKKRPVHQRLGLPNK